MNKPRKEFATKGRDQINFFNYKNTHMQDYIAYLDFECALPKEDSQKCSECSRLKCKCDKSYIKDISKQIPIGYSF